MMHSLSLLALASVAMGCLNVNSNACASFIKSQSATASAFCATYTQTVATATTGLPAWATNCSNKPKMISAECSCHYTGGGGSPGTSTTATATTTRTTTTTQGGGSTVPAPTGVTTTLPASSGVVTSAVPITVSGSFDGGMRRYDRSSKFHLSTLLITSQVY